MANVKQFKLTAEGLKKCEDELEYLKSVKRKDIADKIKVALSFGDLSENSEYDEAKNEQAQVESRILELETMLKNVVIIDESEITTDVIRIGVKIKLLDVDLNEEEEYQIVGSTEANPLKGSISDESPVGRAMLGRSVGDLVEVEAPGGNINYRVLEIAKSK
jgi:transcription elongation factor GreA